MMNQAFGYKLYDGDTCTHLNLKQKLQKRISRSPNIKQDISIIEQVPVALKLFALFS